MRHEPENIALPVANARNVGAGTIGIGSVGRAAVAIAIPHENLPIDRQIAERRIIGKITPFAVCDREIQDRACRRIPRECRVWRLDAHQVVLADEMKVAVAHERSREQAGLAEDLKSIANPNHLPAAGGEFAHRLHDWRKLRNRPAPEVIAVGKSARDDHDIAVGQRGIFVPDRFGCCFGQRIQSK